MRSSALMVLITLGSAGVAQAQNTPPASGAPQFITIGNNAILSSRLIGLDVQSASGKEMGRIEDVVFEGGNIAGIVLSVGEVLGVGQRYVAVDPSSISIRYMESENKWHAAMNADLDQLKAARNSGMKASGGVDSSPVTILPHIGSHMLARRSISQRRSGLSSGLNVTERSEVRISRRWPEPLRQYGKTARSGSTGS